MCCQADVRSPHVLLISDAMPKLKQTAMDMSNITLCLWLFTRLAIFNIPIPCCFADIVSETSKCFHCGCRPWEDVVGITCICYLRACRWPTNSVCGMIHHRKLTGTCWNRRAYYIRTCWWHSTSVCGMIHHRELTGTCWNKWVYITSGHVAHPVTVYMAWFISGNSQTLAGINRYVLHQAISQTQ